MKFILNLSKGFSPVEKDPLGDELEFETKIFLGGERHFIIKDTFKPDLVDEVFLTVRMNSAEDVLLVIVASDALRRLGWERINLVAPYFPAARQDRVCNVGEAFTVKIMADLINRCKFNKVVIFSPHSDVAPALIDNVEIVDLDASFVEDIIDINILPKEGDRINIICPDAGARKRIEKIALQLTNMYAGDGVEFVVVGCEKIRDVKDGALKGFFVNADDLGGHPSIIIDDIIAMGGTFIGLGAELRKKNCGKLYLYTSHADCQAGLNNVAPHFDGIFTTNSKHTFTESEKIHILGISIQSRYS